MLILWHVFVFGLDQRAMQTVYKRDYLQLLGGIFALSVLCRETIRASICLAKRKTQGEMEITLMVNDIKYTE